jgi:hypothetical protein
VSFDWRVAICERRVTGVGVVPASGRPTLLEAALDNDAAGTEDTTVEVASVLITAAASQGIKSLALRRTPEENEVATVAAGAVEQLLAGLLAAEDESVAWTPSALSAQAAGVSWSS